MFALDHITDPVAGGEVRGPVTMPTRIMMDRSAW